MMRIVDILYGLPNILLVVLLAVAVDGITTRAGADLSRFPTREKLHRWLMGPLMRELIGRVEGRRLYEQVGRRLELVERVTEGSRA